MQVSFSDRPDKDISSNISASLSDLLGEIS